MRGHAWPPLHTPKHDNKQRGNTMEYQVLACAETHDAVVMYEAYSYKMAEDWLAGYVRDGFGGWDEFLIQNSDGEPQSSFDEYGWTHY
jgi:hypothetical protein